MSIHACAVGTSSTCSLQSLRGLSQTKLEDTKLQHLELSMQALDCLATKTIARCA